MELDVTVLDRNERPVRGLAAADFSVFEDGQPQELVSFQEIAVPGPDPAGAPWLRDIAPDVTSNEPAGGRIVVIVLDDATMPPNPMIVKTAKEIALEAISRLGLEDRAAVLFTRDNSNSQDFTADRALAQESFSSERAADLSLEVPVSDLSPGAHVLTIEARAGKTTARRDIRFQMR